MSDPMPAFFAAAVVIMPSLSSATATIRIKTRFFATRCFFLFLRGGDGSCYIVVQAKVPEQARADTPA